MKKNLIKESYYGSNRYNSTYGKWANDLYSRKIYKPESFFPYEIGFYTSEKTNKFTSNWSKEISSREIISAVDEDKMKEERAQNSFLANQMSYGHVKSEYGKMKQRNALDVENKRQKEREDKLKEIGEPAVEIAKEYWNSVSTESDFVNEIKENLNKDKIPRLKGGIIAWAIWKANHDAIDSSNENENESEIKEESICYSFDEIYNVIMESIDFDNEISKSIKSMMWFYGRFFKVMPKEKAYEVAKTASKMIREYFQKALENDEILKDDVIFCNRLVISKFKVLKIEDNYITYTGEAEGSMSLQYGKEIRTEIDNGRLMPNSVLDYIENEAKPYFEAKTKEINDRKKEDEENLKKKYDDETATYNTPEFKQFENEYKEKFGDTLITRILDPLSKEKLDYLKNVFKENPDIKKGLLNQINHVHFADPNIKYLDDGAYFQQLQRDTENNVKVKNLANLIENL